MDCSASGERERERERERKRVKEGTFSILCLTTDPIHQGHEKRKEIRDVSTFTARHVRAATQSIKCQRQ